MNSASNLKTYLRHEKGNLILITITGLIYNIGMVAGPWFEGQLVQTLADILDGNKVLADMLILAAIYVLTILFVQVMRFFKRLYVRKFANNINKEMKENLYHTILSEDVSAEESGSFIAKAITDVDACVEGIRKFVTEVFDTGVVMVSYVVLLAVYDWRLTLIVLLFPPIAYYCAQKFKTVVTESTQAARISSSNLNEASLDRVSNALTYRMYGEESNQNQIYETYLHDYERKQAKANILIASAEPLYQIISLISVIFIFYFGAKNVLGQGWASWNIAAFSTYLACFAKLAKKSSTAAKLFNSVQKASVSWKRIKPHLADIPPFPCCTVAPGNTLAVEHVTFGYTEEPLFSDLNFKAKAGDIIGITGEVACGKTTLGKLFLNVLPYQGSITLNRKPLAEYKERTVSYLGHDPQLFSSTIGENISLVSDDGSVKVHIHTNDPGLALQKAMKYGALNDVKIENMRGEHKSSDTNVSSQGAHSQTNDESMQEPVSEHKDVGFIAVSVGDGIKEIFKSLGADYIIEGGQTMNPSTDDMLKAIDKVNADTIFILPNNKNIILAANQAVTLATDKKIIVIPTKTVPQGITALINYVPDVSPDDNAKNMADEISGVHTGQVTYAVRDTVIDDKTIKQGDFMGIGDHGILSVGSDMSEVTFNMIGDMISDDTELISIYYGSDIKSEDADTLKGLVSEKYPKCDVELEFGGQPIYYYIVSAE